MENTVKFDNRLIQELEERNEFGDCMGCVLDWGMIIGGSILLGFGEAPGAALIVGGVAGGYNGSGTGNCQD